MKKIIRLTESDLVKLVKRVISEQTTEAITLTFNNDPEQQRFIDKFLTTGQGGKYFFQATQDPCGRVKFLTQQGGLQGKTLAGAIEKMGGCMKLGEIGSVEVRMPKPQTTGKLNTAFPETDPSKIKPYYAPK